MAVSHAPHRLHLPGCIEGAICLQHDLPWALKSRIGSSGPAAKDIAEGRYISQSGSSSRKILFFCGFIPAGFLDEILTCSSSSLGRDFSPFASFLRFGQRTQFQLDRALNTRIGSSGAGACLQSDVTSNSAFQDDFGIFLSVIESLVQPFTRSLLLIAALSLVKLLVGARLRRSPLLNKLLWPALAFVPQCCVLPLQVATVATPVFDWAQDPSQKPRRSKPVPQDGVLRLGKVARLILFCIGFLNQPVCVWTMPAGMRVPEVKDFLLSQYESVATGGLCQQTSVQAETRPSESHSPDALPGQCINLPPHSHGPPPYSQEHWLGVTVYAPHTQPTTFAIRASKQTSLATVIADVRRAGRLPHPDFDTVVAVHPQPYDGSLTLLEYPSIIAQGREPHCATLIDLTRVGGRLYATTLPESITTAALIDRVRLQVRADYEDDELQVWVGYATVPASRTGTLSLSQGIYVCLTRVPHEPGRPTLVSDLFSEQAQWDRIDQLIRPPQIYDLALCQGFVLDAVRPSFFPWATPAEIACKVYRLDPDKVPIVLIDSEPPLDITGEPCAQVAVALVTADGQPAKAEVQAYYLDLRRLGVAPRFVLFQQSIPDLPQILEAVDIELPLNFAGQVLSNQLCNNLQVLQVGVTVDLAYQVFNSIDLHAGVEASAPPFGVFQRSHNAVQVELGNTVGQPLQQVPPRFGQDIGDPEAHAVLRLDEADTDDAQDTEFVQVGFQIHIPGFCPEILQITLPIPCTLDDALHELSEARLTDVSIQFDNLIAAEPQPDPSFACVIALPEWDGDKPCCIVDARTIDGRLYACLFHPRLNRSSILLQAGISDANGTQVFVEAELLLDHGLYPLHHGATITVLPVGHAFRRGQSLAQMLSVPSGWQWPCPVYEGIDPSAFLLLSDGGEKTIHVDFGQETTSATFKQLAVDHFLYHYERTTICPSKPRLLDAMHRGQKCQAVVAATEQISRIPVPPGRPLPRQHILFVDQRRLFSGITWRLAPHGFVHLQSLVNELQRQVPAGYAVEIRGANLIHKGTKTYLQVEHGQLVTAICVADPPLGEGSGGESQHGSDSGPDSGDSSDSTDDILRSPTSDARRSPASRSRSPKGPPPPEPIRDVAPEGSSRCALAWPDCVDKDQVVQSLTFSGSLVFGHAVNADLLSSQWDFWPPCRIDTEQTRIKSAKLLTEPVPSDATDEQRLNDLRSSTIQLGYAWMHTDRMPFPGEVQPPDVEPEQRIGRVPETEMWINCAVLKDGYVPERISIHLTVPATPQEAQAALQAARQPHIRTLFPSVIDVHPQPHCGTAVYVAAPAWCPGFQGACVDASQLDDRIYAALLPDYIARHELLALVSYPNRDDLQIWVGIAPHPLLDEQPVHLYPGVLITILPSFADAPIPYTTGQLLLMRDAWSPDFSLPMPAVDDAYCLILDRRARLHIADPAAPTRYRRDIAATLRLSAEQIRLFAAQPRPRDVAIQGVNCRTALAVGVNDGTASTPAWHCVVLDCRPIQEGWRALRVFDGRFNAEALIAQFQLEAPRGWEVRLDAEISPDGFISARPGQIIVVTYVAASATQEQPAPDASQRDGVSDEAPPPDQSDAGSGTDESEVVPDRHDAVSISGENRIVHSLSVFIYSQEYVPEHLRIRLEDPLTVEAILDTVELDRQSAAARIFPDLVAIHPQPSSRHVALLAMPAWPYVGTPILVQVLGPAARTFAVCAPAVLSKVGVLRLAACADDAACQVYIGDTPWPLPEDGAFPVHRGDLITVCPDTHPMPRLHTLFQRLHIDEDLGLALSDPVFLERGSVAPHRPATLPFFHQSSAKSGTAI